VSQTTASGAGGSAAPGWYTDPHDPSQLRWWSGEAWTEHVSGGAPAQPVAGQPVVQSGTDPLPSRRALRDPATEASEAAEAALQAQQAAQLAQAQQAAQAQQEAQAQQAAQAQLVAQQAQLAAQQAAQAAAQPPVPQVASQPSPPAPTLPVEPRSFLEQAGYAPLDSAPADPNGWNSAQAQQQAPAQVAPQQFAPQQLAPQQVAPQQVAPQQVAPGPVAPSQPVQPLQASAWDQAAQQVNEFSGLTPGQNQWNQPGAPASPGQQGWDAPGTAAPAAGGDGIDALFGAAPATPSTDAAADPAAAGWGLSPSGPRSDQGSRRRDAEAAAPETAGSSTFWSWLIAISPILAAASIGYVLVSTGYVLSGWPIEAAVAAPYLLVLLFALADRSALQGLGHSAPRSPGWALLSAPVYLIVRASETRREDGSGTLLTLVWFFSVLVGIGGFVGYGLLTHHALIAGLPS
jgi:hypothetical protein